MPPLAHLGEANPGAPSRSRAVPSQTKNLLRRFLLLMLDEHPDYGYDLRERIGDLSWGQWDGGTMYRVLNALEDEGLAHSTWEASPNGPQRRRYEITGEGQAVLSAWCNELEEVCNLLLGFLDRYERDRQAHLVTLA